MADTINTEAFADERALVSCIRLLTNLDAESRKRVIAAVLAFFDFAAN